VLAGRFVLERVLGTGGMATVWSARDTRLDRTVALKILRPDLSEEHADRIEREARAAARIDDHRVVTVLDLDHTDDGTPFLVFEALSGATLADELRTSGALALERAQRLAADLLGGLAAAHDCGVLHRDIKPSNVLIGSEGFRITDFGIASMDDDGATRGDLMGTLVYVAPERFDGAPATPQADLFSAAAVLYEALTGHQPFRGESSTESLARLRNGDFVPLPSHVPDRFAAAVTDGLAADPAARPADAATFARRVDPSAVDATEPLTAVDPTERLDLTTRLEQPTEPTLAPLAPPPLPPAEEPAVLDQARRPQTIFIALGVVLLILLFLAASAGDGGDPQPETPEEQLELQLERIEEIGR
jgi:serine/threonine protein kinase